MTLQIGNGVTKVLIRINLICLQHRTSQNRQGTKIYRCNLGIKENKTTIKA